MTTMCLTSLPFFFFVLKPIGNFERKFPSAKLNFFSRSCFFSHWWDWILRHKSSPRELFLTSMCGKPVEDGSIGLIIFCDVYSSSDVLLRRFMQCLNHLSDKYLFHFFSSVLMLRYSPQSCKPPGTSWSCCHAGSSWMHSKAGLFSTQRSDATDFIG